METKTTPSTSALNRLRAAAALIPIIESGIAESKISHDRAAHMASFVEWAATLAPENPSEQDLVSEITAGLSRLKVALNV